MDRFADKQRQINQRRGEVSALYPTLWSKMITEWNMPDPEDRVWLMYSANYLFRTNHILWAIDPLTLSCRVKDAPKVNVAQDLRHLSFVLLTHSHKDHLDLDLLSLLRDLPVKWIIPESLLAKVIRLAGLPPERIIVPSPLASIEINGIHILPFDGLHWETTSDGALRGVPAMGYLIECNGRRWLFPGDTRNYDTSQLSSLAPADILFAHLWLGRGSALMDEPPMVDAFCRFCLDLEPGRVILAHLNEFGRDANDLWDESHARCVSSKIGEINPDISVTPAYMGEHVLL